MDLPLDPVDFLIVGGGLAGCALASRLSEDAGTHVLLAETGTLAPAPPGRGIASSLRSSQ